ncbi:MAG: beta-D-glucoside glucohydrolase [Alphaproteobacteria bacterium HGW-Alphaproteobacteria-18]|nr:MAG: beta-D-glucoside glucohydrolase [Alphaproteobacteria bacterium HGW-Alphaproteobacteria-18]
MATRTPDTEARISALLERMTLEEKVSLMAGRDFWTLPAIERLGIPSLRVSDGPTGLRSVNSEAATVFPVGVALAATWNETLVAEVGAAIAREAIAHEVDVLLAPAVNIQRTPLGGRNFETYSEDPRLAAEIATAYVAGVQSEGVGTSLKHYAANNQEHERMTGSSDMSERTLREIYLAVYEPVIRRANPWTVMGAYNKVNGVFACENEFLLEQVLKGEWGYDGVVVSDWGATKTTAEAANHGMDLEMPGPARHFGAKLVEAVRNGDVSQAVVDDHARRLLRLIIRCGLLDGNPKSARGELCSARHRACARDAAGQSMVLLKNEGGLLPVSKNVRRVAVIGQPAYMPAIQGGGSSQVSPDRIVSPLEGLKAALGSDVELIFERGLDHEPAPPQIDWRLLSPDETFTQHGLTARYYAKPGCAGPVAHEEIDWHFSKLGFGGKVQTEDDLSFSVEWTGYFRPEQDGDYDFVISHSNEDVELSIGNEILVGQGTPSERELLFMILPLNRREARMRMQAGRTYPIRIRYSQPTERAIRAFNIFNISMRPPAPSRAAAIAAARAADMVLLFVGSGTTDETEGRDRRSMKLSAGQDDFVREVVAANPGTAVIVNTGAPVEMPWAGDVPAILQMWLPGGEGGSALEDLLSGKVSPSGKLPVTFPHHYEDNPTYPFYPGHKSAEYGEGIFVGYRYYDKAGRDVLFPFGHGLTYSRFEISDLQVSVSPSAQDVEVSLNLTNTGAVEAAETVQLYLEDRATREAMPPRQLKAFRKTSLKPGETARLTFVLVREDFAWFDMHAGAWVVSPGKYAVHAGVSSRDLRQAAEFELHS